MSRIVPQGSTAVGSTRLLGGPKRELQTHVRGFEPEAFIEPLRVTSGRITRELYEPAPSLSRACDGLQDQPLADLRPSVSSTYSHALQLRPSHSGTAHAGDDRQLQAADHLIVSHGDEQLVARLARHLIKSVQIDRRDRVLHKLAMRAEHIVSEQSHNRRYVLASGKTHTN